jgi:hypothetical protein
VAAPWRPESQEFAERDNAAGMTGGHGNFVDQREPHTPPIPPNCLASASLARLRLPADRIEQDQGQLTDRV